MDEGALVDQTGGWAQECAELLAAECFPAGQDDLLAALVRQHAPSRLLRRLAAVSRERVFTDLDDLMSACQENGQDLAARDAADALRH